MLPFRSLDPFRPLREPDRRRRDEERLSRSEQRTANKPKDHLTGKAPYKFESGFLQRRVRLSTGIGLARSRSRLFARVCGPCQARESAETGMAGRHRTTGDECLCWAKFQYRGAGDGSKLIAASCR